MCLLFCSLWFSLLLCRFYFLLHLSIFTPSPLALLLVRFLLVAYPVFLSLLCTYFFIFSVRFIAPYFVFVASLCPVCLHVVVVVPFFISVSLCLPSPPPREFHNFITCPSYYRGFQLLICMLFLRPASLPRGNLPMGLTTFFIAFVPGSRHPASYALFLSISFLSLLFASDFIPSVSSIFYILHFIPLFLVCPLYLRCVRPDFCYLNATLRRGRLVSWCV